jgi:DNA-binding NarL/FixJ family response regulator
MRAKHIGASGLDISTEIGSPAPRLVYRDHIGALASAQTGGRSAIECNLTVIVEHRAFVRDCLTRGLANSCADGRIEAYACLRDWVDRDHPLAASTVLLLSGGDRDSHYLQDDWTKALEDIGSDVRVVLLAEDESSDYIKAALSHGVRGYIPTSAPLSVAIEAIRLVRAGGIYIPASSFLNGGPRSSALEHSQLHGKPSGLLESFTGRQAAVVQELLKGNSNKIIAYDLAMKESTVKVHVRNIMKKLKARNRTHVAFLLNKM